MELSAYSIYQLVNVVCSLTKETTLKKSSKLASKRELEAAMRDLNGLKFESNSRECLNRVLGHLESAFSHYKPSTWNKIDDEDRLLWDQRTYKNEICMTIAAIHLILGNPSLTRKWLSDDICEYGWISMPEGTLELLGMSNYEEFFNAVYNDNGQTYRQLEWSIKCHFDNAYDDSGYNPLTDSYF